MENLSRQRWKRVEKMAEVEFLFLKGGQPLVVFRWLASESVTP